MWAEIKQLWNHALLVNLRTLVTSSGRCGKMPMVGKRYIIMYVTHTNNQTKGDKLRSWV